MYFYLMSPTAPAHTLVSDTCPDGYTSFQGNPLAREDGFVDWGNVGYENGELFLRPVPEPAEAKPVYVAPEPTVEQVKYSELNSIKSALQSTDYQCLKFVDGALTEAEYQPVKAYRATLRQLYAVAEQANDVATIQSLPVPQSFGNDVGAWYGTQWNFAGALGNESF